MEDHIKIRQEHVRLVRAGELDEAQKILEKIWGRKTINYEKSTPVVKLVETTKDLTKESVDNYKCLDNLTKIKGIGKKTVMDIKIIFKDIKELTRALKADSVPLRDDIVEKLKEELI